MDLQWPRGSKVGQNGRETYYLQNDSVQSLIYLNNNDALTQVENKMGRLGSFTPLGHLSFLANLSRKFRLVVDAGDGLCTM